MVLRSAIAFVALSGGLLGWGTTSVSAQGLIWQLPEPGTWVRYEGDYTQTERRPKDANNKDLTIGPWRRHLTVKALERVQEPDANGGDPIESQWLEFVVDTGLEKDGMLVGGPGSRRVYKILASVAELEQRIGPPKDKAVVDNDQIPVTFLPIRKGFRQIGDKPAEAMTSTVFNVHPAVTLLAPYRSLEEVAADENPQVNLPGVTNATHYHGSSIVESKSERNTNQAEIWFTSDAPFGLVRWDVTVERQTKELFDTRDKFQTASTYKVEMKAVEKGQNATSLLTEK